MRGGGRSGCLQVDDLAPLLADGRVRVLALTAVSNALGLRTPVAAAAAAAHAAGARIVVDAVHAAPHGLPDVRAWDADYLLFSPYKVFAPHLGVLFAAERHVPELDAPTLWFYDRHKISKMEYGTAPYEALAGVCACVYVCVYTYMCVTHCVYAYVCV